MYEAKLEIDWLREQNKSLGELQAYCDSLSNAYNDKIHYLNSEVSILENIQSNNRNIIGLQQKKIDSFTKKIDKSEVNKKLLFIMTTIAGVLTVVLILK